MFGSVWEEQSKKACAAGQGGQGKASDSRTQTATGKFNGVERRAKRWKRWYRRRKRQRGRGCSVKKRSGGGGGG
eukprot:656899-Rhodomonas_salina.2